MSSPTRRLLQQPQNGSQCTINFKELVSLERNRFRGAFLLLFTFFAMIHYIADTTKTVQAVRILNGSGNIPSRNGDSSTGSSFSANSTSSPNAVESYSSYPSNLSIVLEAKETMPSSFAGNLNSTDSDFLKVSSNRRPISASLLTTSFSNDTHHILNQASNVSLSNQVSKASSENPFLSCKGLNFTEPAVCGANKCFVLVNHEPEIGYLVARFGTKSWLSNMNAAYKRAKRLQDRYQIRHLYVDPPELVTVPRCVYKQLSNRKHYLKPSNPGGKFSIQGQTLVIQKNVIAPNPHVFFGFAKRKMKVNVPMMKTFVEEHVTNMTAFLERLRQERNRTLTMLKDEPCMAFDFQVMLDRHGNFYHMDFDRCSKKIPVECYNRTVERLNEVVDDTIKRARQLSRERQKSSA